MERTRRCSGEVEDDKHELLGCPIGQDRSGNELGGSTTARPPRWLGTPAKGNADWPALLPGWPDAGPARYPSCSPGRAVGATRPGGPVPFTLGAPGEPGRATWRTEGAK